MSTTRKFAIRAAVIVATIAALTLFVFAHANYIRVLTEECDAGRASSCAKLAARR